MAAITPVGECWLYAFGDTMPDWVATAESDIHAIRRGIQKYRSFEVMISSVLKEQGYVCEKVLAYSQCAPLRYEIGDIVVGDIIGLGVWGAKIDEDYIPKVVTPGGVRPAKFALDLPVQIWRKDG